MKNIDHVEINLRKKEEKARRKIRRERIRNKRGA